MAADLFIEVLIAEKEIDGKDKFIVSMRLSKGFDTNRIQKRSVRENMADYTRRKLSGLWFRSSLKELCSELSREIKGQVHFIFEARLQAHLTKEE